MAKSTVLVLCVVTLCCCVSQGEASSAFKKINNYLVDKVKSDDPAANLQAAKELLAKETSGKHGLFHVNLREPLEKFIELAELKAPDSCNAKGYLVSRYNTDATDGEARNNVNPVRRIDKLVRKFATDHAISCQDVYFARMTEKLVEINPKAFRNIQNFTVPLIRLLLKTEKRPYHLKPSETPISDALLSVGNDRLATWKLAADFYPRTIYKTIKGLANEDNDQDVRFLAPFEDEKSGKRKVNKAGVDALLEKYLVGPCNYYIDYMGPDLLVPFIHDFGYYNEIDEENHPDFYIGWFMYILSKNLVQRDLLLMRVGLYSLTKAAAENDELGDTLFAFTNVIANF